MEKTYLNDGVLISVLDSIGDEKQCGAKFLTGKVIHDKTNRYQVGKSIITLELELYGRDVFLTKNEIYLKLIIPLALRKYHALNFC